MGSGFAECRNHPPRSIRARRQLLVGWKTRSPQRVRKTRAFLLTKTYMDAGDTVQGTESVNLLKSDHATV